MNWTPDQLPELDGKTYLITGGNSGIGLEAAKILCAAGAHVIIGARSEAKAQGAIDELVAGDGSASVSWVQLDLTDPDSIQAAADEVIADHPQLDAVINNAGVMQPPERKTDEGFELQFATNHLGHFRLNRALYPHLVKSKGRIVPVSSVIHHQGKIELDDLMSRNNYNATTAYGQSKLANLMYAFELDRRLEAAGSPVICVPCHPGYSATNLQTAGVGMDGGSSLYRVLYKFTNAVLAQDAHLGAYPEALAAAWPDAERGVYYGPTRWRDMNGPVGKSRVASQALDEEVQRKLWEATEKLVGEWVIA